MPIYFWNMMYYSTIYVGFLTTVLCAFIKISKDATHHTHANLIDLFMLTMLSQV